MAYRIISPANSFVQFNESNVVQSCNFEDISLCLPVFDDDDVFFQFVIDADTVEEADVLCTLNQDNVAIGIAATCDSANLLTFTADADRYRLSDTQILYNWPNGFPSFKTVVPVGGCFYVTVTVVEDFSFCSNCFQRILDDCHTSVLEYGNDEDAFGFNYCNSVPVDADTADCAPTFISFTNQLSLNIPYTAAMLSKYGNIPTIKTWIYNGANLENQQIYQALDAYPPTNLILNFGGLASGVVKIS